MSTTDADTPHRRIMERCGGLSAVARMMGRPVSTVQRWWQSGRIPAQHHDALLSAARAQGIDLEPADFFRPPVDAGEVAR